MTDVPGRLKIYHITHIDNLPEIIRSGVLWSDARRIEFGLKCQIVGLSNIKRRWLENLPVPCHPGTTVGQYVPFYFCPRSVMLYILHMGNHPELTYRGGQKPVVHLVADLPATVQWASAEQRRWAFSDINAGTSYARFFARVEDLPRVNWDAVRSTDWRDPVAKDGKQAEFLVYESFSWQLIEKIGVYDLAIERRVRDLLPVTEGRPVVSVERTWYY